MLFFKKKNKKENKTLTKKEAFEKLLIVKKKINALKKELKKEDYIFDEDNKKEQLEEELKKLYRIYEKLEQHLIDVKKGLYIGIGIDLMEEEERLRPVYINWNTLNSHLGVQGTTRVGKTVFMLNIARQIIRKGDDLFIAEPKGSKGHEVLASVLEEALNSGRAQDFFYISPAFTSISDRINIIFGMNNETLASIMANAIENAPGKGERFYSDVVYKVVLAIAMAFEVIEDYQEFKSPGFVKKLIEKEIKKYNSMIKAKGFNREPIKEEQGLYNPDTADLALRKNRDILELEQLKNSSLKEMSSVQQMSYLFSRTLMTLKDIAAFSTHDTLLELRDYLQDLFIVDGDIRKDITKSLQNKAIEAINVLGDVAKQEKQFFEKTSTSLSTILTQLSSGKMGEVFSSIRINPLLFRMKQKDKGIICVIQSFPMLFDKISDMTVKIILQMIKYQLGLVGAKGVGLHRRVHIMIDEAASVVFPGISDFFNKAGGLDGSMYVFTQSFADWKQALGEDEAAKVMDNINTQVRMRMNDIQSCEIVAKEFGTVKKVEQNVIFEGESSRFMSMQKEEWIVSPDAVRKLPVGRAAVKSESDFYVVDLPYYSGAKAKIILEEYMEDNSMAIAEFYDELIEVESAEGN